jgi:deazaflavin-dependent oxidoreductase (nitroreductase family)
MSSFTPEVVEAAAQVREVTLTTVGRKSGKPHPVTIWVVADGRRIFIRSGEGLRRHWPQNLLSRGGGELQLGKLQIKVKPRLVTDPTEAREVSALYRRKYGPFVRASKPNQPLTPGEQATFELIPAG